MGAGILIGGHALTANHTRKHRMVSTILEHISCTNNVHVHVEIPPTYTNCQHYECMHQTVQKFQSFPLFYDIVYY